MSKFQRMRSQLLKGEITFKDLFSEQAEFVAFSDKAMDVNRDIDIKEFEAFLKLCLDVYVFDSSGKVLISDRVYDMCMESWKYRKQDAIIFPDPLQRSKSWELEPHRYPGLVGTLPKAYEYSEVKSYLKMIRDAYGTNVFIVAPKYDGISAAVKVKDEFVTKALTRYDGAYGQNITKIIQRAKPIRPFEKDGWYKCEIVMSSENLEKLKAEKSYANRRSATSGIVNTPQNVEYGKYLTIIPLLYWNPEENVMEYNPPYSKKYDLYSPRDMMDYMEERLKELRSDKFPFRVDGMVMFPEFPKGNRHAKPNPGNLMELGMAFKVNTAQALTTVEYCYFSIGKLGGATPMAKVKPVEVNETVVTDVSLGSYARFKDLNLYEGEEVIVYSAGDVIPQLKKTDYSNNIDDAPYLKIPKYCPYCKARLTRENEEYSCTNPNCIRVVSGKIANFAEKMNIEGFADKTFEDFVSAGILRDIPGLFEITEDQIAALPGYDRTSASNFVEQITKLKNSEVQISQLIGALGIKGISKKKSRKIFEIVDIEYILSHSSSRVRARICGADGIGMATANVFCDFMENNRDMIEKLMKYLHVVSDKKLRGNIVFTGFRSPVWEKKFNDIGFGVATSVTKKTNFVIAANQTLETGNVKAAIKKEIPIYYYEDIDQVYDRYRLTPVD